MSSEIQVIEARPATLVGRIKSAWQYRGYWPILFKEITMRKFRNTVLGWWWLILRPLIPVVAATITFTYFVEIDTGDLPYGIFFLSSFIVWNLLEALLMFMSRTMMWTRNLMKKMYMPKLLVPLASVGPPLVELVITVIALLVLSGFYYFTQDVFYVEWDWKLLLFPVCILLAMVLAISIGMVIGVIALLMKDIIYSIRYVMQLLLFVTPVIYPLSSIPKEAQWAFIAFNPMTGVVETCRWALTGFGDWTPILLVISIVQITLIALLCLTFFSRADSFLSDMV